MADVNLGQLAATTFDNYQPEFTDNIFKKHALLDHLRENGGTKVMDGGVYFRTPVLYGTNSTVKAFTGTDVLDLTYQEGMDTAQWSPAFYDVSVVFTLTDKLQNKGKSQIVSLLEGKIKQAEISLAERIADDLFNGAGSASKEIVGLDTMIAATGTVGTISGTTYSWWRSYVESSAEAFSFAKLRTAKNTANNGNGGSKVSLIVTTQTLYEKAHSLLTATYQMNPIATKESHRLADAGFENLEFEGVPMVYDEAATSGVVYLINVDNYKLFMMQGADFKRVEKASPADQHIDVMHIVFGGAAITNRRASLAKLTAKTG